MSANIKSQHHLLINDNYESHVSTEHQYNIHIVSSNILFIINFNYYRRRGRSMKSCEAWFAIAILALMGMAASTSGDPCSVSSNMYYLLQGDFINL